MIMKVMTMITMTIFNIYAIKYLSPFFDDAKALLDKNASINVAVIKNLIKIISTCN